VEDLQLQGWDMSTTSEYEPDEDEEEASAFELAADPEEEHPDRSDFLNSPPPRSARRQSLSATSGDDDTSAFRASQTAASRLRQIRRKGLTKKSIHFYRRLLNDMLHEMSPDAPLDEDFRRNYQHGIVTWTASEREIFFDLLSQKGKTGIREIAQSIRSKSELEVQIYIKLLDKGLQHQQLHERHTTLITLTEIPAAYEISQDLEMALEELSEHVSLLEQEAEDRAAMKKHGDQFWVIDGATADEVEAKLDDEGTPSSGSSIFLSASLLNIKRWIQLSERLFMNAGEARLEDNWRNICFRNESPSLTADSFADFYALTVSITRRIVQASIFFAMGRARNFRHQTARTVKARDVRAALDVLNMKHDTFDFYVELPRRLCLDVADIRHVKGWDADYMRYDDVEDTLSGRGAGSSFRDRSFSIYQSDGDVHDEEDDPEIDNREDDYVTEDYHGNESLVSDDDTYSNEEDVYAEFVDARTSKDEEIHLRESLACPIIDSLPPVIKAEDHDEVIGPPPKRTLDRKTDQDVIDWRDRILYRSEWEEYGSILEDINGDLAENRRKRRRIDRGDEPVSHKSQRVQRRSSVGYQTVGSDEDDNGGSDHDDGDKGDFGDEDEDDDVASNNDGNDASEAGDTDIIPESEAETDILESIEPHGVEMENVVIRHTVDDWSDEEMAHSDHGG
jgi:RNA polymerase I-specific transcription initiation factor RRN5